MITIDDYFTNHYVSDDEDTHVIDLVKEAKYVLDVGCGDNLFKKYGKVLGLDPYNSKADVMMDILDFEPVIKYPLIICFGSINFYDAKWVDDRMKKVATLLEPKGRICFKVNPNKAFGNGVRLDWFDRWTVPLIQHYAEIFNYEVECLRKSAHGRIKFDYVAR